MLRNIPQQIINSFVWSSFNLFFIAKPIIASNQYQYSVYVVLRSFIWDQEGCDVAKKLCDNV